MQSYQFHFHRKKIAWLLLVLGGLINAPECLFPIENVGTTNQLQSQVNNNSPGVIQEILTDLWVEVKAPESVPPVGDYECRIKIKNDGSLPVNNIIIIFYPPNAKNRLIDPAFDKLYTEYVREKRDINLVNESVRQTSNELIFQGKIEKITWTIPILSSGDSTEITVYLRIPDEIEANTILNHDFFILENNATVPSLIIPVPVNVRLVPELVALKSVTGPDTVQIGDEVEYRIRITNQGGKDAQYIIVTDELPALLNFIEFLSPIVADTSGFTTPDSTMRWVINELKKGETKTLRYKARVKNFSPVKPFTEIQNLIKAKRGDADSAFAKYTIQVRSDPDLTPRFVHIPEPKDWKLTTGIGIEVFSRIFNIGGSPFKEPITLRYWYYFSSTPFAPEPCEPLPSTAPIRTWEITVNQDRQELAANMNPVRDDGLIVPPQQIQIMNGGYYRYYLSVDPQNTIREKNDDNNLTCIDDTIRVPLQFYLGKNEFRPDVAVEPLKLWVQVPNDCHLEVDIYDEAGTFVRKQVDTYFELEGIYQLTPWDGRDKNGDVVASGIYVFNLQTQDRSISRKVVVIR